MNKPTINGKTLTKSEENLLNKLATFGVVAASNSEVRENPYTGVKHTLDPLAVALYDFIIGSYQNYLATRGQFSWNGNKFPVSVWDRSRHLFLKLWPDQYYDLID